MCNCAKDGSRPPEVCLQGPASNRPVLLRSKGVVVSDWEKALLKRQVSNEKMSASEPLMTHRESRNEAVKTGGEGSPQDKPEGNLITVQAAVGVKAA